MKKVDSTKERDFNYIHSVQVPKELRDSSIEKHDRYNFEVKLDYHLEKEKQRNKYQVNAYFFIPHALQINHRTYSNDEFFADVNNYIRFKTPRMALSGLLNEENHLSPIHNIKICLEKIENGNLETKNFNKIKYELRVLGCIVKSTLRDQVDFYKENVSQIVENEDFQEHFLEFLEDIEKLQKRMRKLEQDFSIVQLPEVIRKSFVFVDKYVSLQVLERMHKILKKLILLFESDAPLITQLTALINYEQKHKTEIDSNFQLQEDRDNESYSYWEGLLKKYIQNVLYLNIYPADEKSRALNALYSIAAGIAMFFSVFFSLLLVEKYVGNTLAYMVLLVIIYMGKDRIKGWIRNASNRLVEKYFPDRKFEITDTKSDDTEKTIGTAKETMRFISWKQIPPEIVNIREASVKSMVEREGKPEDVFKFSKDVELYTEEILEYHERHGDVNDIMRFNVRHLLQYADDPYQQIPQWNAESHEIESIQSAKVYHMNVIFKINSLSANKTEETTYYKKIRVIIDQRGIKRVEEPSIKL